MDYSIILVIIYVDIDIIIIDADIIQFNYLYTLTHHYNKIYNFF